MPRLTLLAALLLLAGACAEDNRPTMNPGQDCLTCHTASAPEAHDLPWTAAGTVFGDLGSPDDAGAGGVAEVHILIRDELAHHVLLTSNSAGNFYTAEPLTGKLDVIMEYQGQCTQMATHPDPAYTYTQGDGTVRLPTPGGVGCNHCHTSPPPDQPTSFLSAPGRLLTPQAYGLTVDCADAGYTGS